MQQEGRTVQETAGQRLEAARKDARYSRRQLVEDLEKTLEGYVPSEDTIGRWEQSTDGADWDPVIAVAIAGLCGVKLSELSEAAGARAKAYRDLLIRTPACITEMADQAA